MEEKIFYQEDGVKVSSARFVVGDTTYPTANISSIRKKVKPGLRILAGIPLVMGGLLLFLELFATSTGAENEAANNILYIALGLIAFGIFVWFQMAAKYFVILNTSGNDVSALVSKKQQHIDTIIAALNDAIVYRG